MGVHNHIAGKSNCELVKAGWQLPPKMVQKVCALCIFYQYQFERHVISYRNYSMQKRKLWSWRAKQAFWKRLLVSCPWCVLFFGCIIFSLENHSLYIMRESILKTWYNPIFKLNQIAHECHLTQQTLFKKKVRIWLVEFYQQFLPKNHEYFFAFSGKK